MRVSGVLVTLFLALVLMLMWSGPASAGDPEIPGWYFDADLGGVWTGGNAESNALGAAANLRRVWTRTRVFLKGSASETQTTQITRTATGTADDFAINEQRLTEKSAEFYNAQTGVLHDLSKHFFLLGGVDWMRNRPSGIESRTLLALGAGNTWRSYEDSSLRTYYNFTYTFQDDVVANPFAAADFPGVQVGYVWKQRLTESTRLESDLVGDWNLDNTDDVRADWYNALPVSISSRLELKPALRILWRNDPSFTDVPLVDGSGVGTGESVITQLENVDTIFTLALVVKFAPESEG